MNFPKPIIVCYLDVSGMQLKDVTKIIEHSETGLRKLEVDYHVLILPTQTGEPTRVECISQFNCSQEQFTNLLTKLEEIKNGI